VRTSALRLLNGARGRIGLPYNDQIIGRLQHRANAAAHHGVIVDQEDA
jgi:hypothetical protein